MNETSRADVSRRPIALSVVVCVRNMADTLGRQLDQVLDQETDFAFEVIVVDNESTDDTRAVADRYGEQDARVRVIQASPAGANVARNRGIEAAQAEVVALCDADDEVERGWAAGIVRALEPRTFVGGALRHGGPNSLHERIRWAVEEQKAEVPEWFLWGQRTPGGGNCCFFRSMWREIGGFNEALGLGGDETEFFARAGQAGYRYVRAEDAVVGVRMRSTVGETWRRGYRYGRNGAEVVNIGEQDDSSLVLLVMRWTWLMLQLPRVLVTGRGSFAWLETLAQQTGRAAYRIRWVGRHAVTDSAVGGRIRS